MNPTKANMHVIHPGQVFGKLTVIEEIRKYYSRGAGGRKRPHRFFVCKCECGAVIERMIGKLLKSGDSSACKKCSKPALTHGMYRTKEYSTWQHMKGRCYDPKNKKYHLYGGRGIIVCDRWKDDFTAFFEDMGKMPDDKHSIDRIDPDGDYTLENCRWATVLEQNRNLRTVHYVTYKGVTKPVTVWAEMANRDPSTLRRRSNAHRTDEILSKWLPNF